MYRSRIGALAVLICILIPFAARAQDAGTQTGGNVICKGWKQKDGPRECPVKGSDGKLDVSGECTGDGICEAVSYVSENGETCVIATKQCTSKIDTGGDVSVTKSTELSPKTLEPLTTQGIQDALQRAPSNTGQESVIPQKPDFSDIVFQPGTAGGFVPSTGVSDNASLFDGPSFSGKAFELSGGTVPGAESTDVKTEGITGGTAGESTFRQPEQVSASNAEAENCGRYCKGTNWIKSTASEVGTKVAAGLDYVGDNILSTSANAKGSQLQPGESVTGIASCYGKGACGDGNYFEGKKTAYGDVFRSSELTAASNQLAPGQYTVACVGQGCTPGATVTVNIHDTGSSRYFDSASSGGAGRIVDLSTAAREALGGQGGLIQVSITPVTNVPVETAVPTQTDYSYMITDTSALFRSAEAPLPALNSVPPDPTDYFAPADTSREFSSAEGQVPVVDQIKADENRQYADRSSQAEAETPKAVQEPEPPTVRLAYGLLTMNGTEIKSAWSDIVNPQTPSTYTEQPSSVLDNTISDGAQNGFTPANLNEAPDMSGTLSPPTGESVSYVSADGSLPSLEQVKADEARYLAARIDQAPASLDTPTASAPEPLSSRLAWSMITFDGEGFKSAISETFTQQSPTELTPNQVVQNSFNDFGISSIPDAVPEPVGVAAVPAQPEQTSVSEEVPQTAGLPAQPVSVADATVPAAVPQTLSCPGNSIVDCLASQNLPTSLAYRKQLASELGISTTQDSAAMNSQLLNQIRTTGIPGTTPSAVPTVSESAYVGAYGYTGGSVSDFLSHAGKSSDFAARQTLARQYGIPNYSGTTAQNTQLLAALRATLRVGSR